MSAPARASDIVFARHAARRGLSWLTDALAMFKRARLSWLVLVALYFVLMSVLLEIPYAGALAAPLLKPVFAVGLLAAAWTQERGGRPRVSHLFNGFRANLGILMALGLVYVAGITAAVFLAALFDGGTLLALMSSGANAPAGATQPAPGIDALIRSGELQWSMLLVAFFAMPTVLAMWFAPALVVFQDANLSAALGASLRATLANWKALAIYGLAIAGFGVLMPLIVMQLVYMLAPVPATVAVLRYVFLGYALVLYATLSIAEYVSYRDIFHAGETLTPLSTDPTQPPGGP